MYISLKYPARLGQQHYRRGYCRSPDHLQRNQRGCIYRYHRRYRRRHPYLPVAIEPRRNNLQQHFRGDECHLPGPRANAEYLVPAYRDLHTQHSALLCHFQCPEGDGKQINARFNRGRSDHLQRQYACSAHQSCSATDRRRNTGLSVAVEP